MEDNGDVNHSVKMEKNVQEDKPISYGQPAYGYNLELPRKSYLPPPTGLLAEAKIADPEYGDDEEMDEIAPPSVDSKRHIKEEIAGIASPWDVTSIFEFNYSGPMLITPCTLSPEGLMTRFLDLIWV